MKAKWNVGAIIILLITALAMYLIFDMDYNDTIKESKEYNGIEFITLDGDNFDIGKKIGLKYRSDIKRIIEEYLYKAFPTKKEREKFYKIFNKYKKIIPEDYRIEIDAMAQYSGVLYNELLLLNYSFDLKKNLVSNTFGLGKGMTHEASFYAVNSFETEYSKLFKETLKLFIYKQNGKKKFISIAIPGIVGVFSGINENGLSVSYHSHNKDKNKFNKNLTALFLTRQILEKNVNFRNMSSFISKKRVYSPAVISITGSNSDNKNNKEWEMVAIELSNDKVNMRHPDKEGRLICINDFSGKAESSPFDNKLYKKIYNQINPFTKAFTNQSINGILEKISNNKKNSFNVIWIGKLRKFYLGYGEIPAFDSEFRLFSLKKLFKK